MISTNRWRKIRNDIIFRRTVALPTNFYMALCTAATTPTPDTNVLGDLVEIAAGSNYVAGGKPLNPNTTDFPTSSEDDATDVAILAIRDDFNFLAAAGVDLPATGAEARWAVMTMDGAVVADRVVMYAFDLGSNVRVSGGQSIVIPGMTMRAYQKTA